MRHLKLVLFGVVFCTLIFAFIPLAMGEVGMTVTALRTETYNRFLVADLGLTGEGKQNEVFSVTFGTDAGNTTLHHVDILVESLTDSKTLLSGSTDSLPYDPDFSGKTYDNNNITDATSLGGTFEISEESKSLQDQILATGTLPQGSFQITLTLINDETGATVTSGTVPITINPTYMQPVYPVDTAVSKAGLTFSWSANLQNMEFHLFTDPSGNNEVIMGSLPMTNLGASQNLSGSTIDQYLKKYEGQDLYWQIFGDIETSHGTEQVKGPLSLFQYYEEATTVVDLGLEEVARSEIKDELIKLLREIVNRRAARSIEDYDVDRVVLDNSVVNRDEIMNILLLIKDKKLKVSAIYFR